MNDLIKEAEHQIEFFGSFDKELSKKTLAALKEREWRSVNERLPAFDELVLVYCKIYGRYLSAYHQIDNTNYGNWYDPDGRLGGLPPTKWTPLPPIPAGTVSGTLLHICGTFKYDECPR